MTGRTGTGAAAEVAGWWVVLVLVWLVTTSAFATDELIAACVIALPVALAARVGRIAARGNWRLPAGVARLLAALPGAIVREGAAALLIAARGRPVGRFERLDIGPRTSADRRAGRAALITGVLSATPGSLVIDADHEGLLLHALATPATRLRRMFGG
ncbi:Na+/H+ antiporter subunit E [Nocardia sp. CA-119907]|uniref:Na+/H+ antiporter subunit E n=1 Tax=Nocardia sp. CA-119907 TaxID=3239973 RepID=UPI003D99B1D3